MSFEPIIKQGENISLRPEDIRPASYAAIQEDTQIIQRFSETAKELKKIAPKANEFLYFSAHMMTAAEASLYDDKGKIRKNADGSDVTAHWEKNGESLKWVCSDKSIFPYANANKDIFNEEQLILAHKNWVGKPLCIDHKSSSVDHIRGIIVDTYYDFPMKRVIALCALDQINYPDLARKVKTGYSTDVSMGTAVERAICYDCGKVARTEPEFCEHMRNKTCYGEINVGLKPIELSIVVNGADQRAKIRHIIASLNNYSYKKAFDPKKALEGEKIDVTLVDGIIKRMNELEAEISSLELSEERKKELNEILGKVEKDVQELGKREREEVQEYQEESQKMTQEKESAFVMKNLVKNIDKLQNSIERIEKKMADKRAYYQGTEEPKPGQLQYPKEEGPDVARDKHDKHMQNPQDMGPVNGLFPGDEAKKKHLQRAAQEVTERRLRREAALKRAKEQSKKAYMQGTEEPTPGKPKYPKEEADKLREKDKHFEGAPPFPGVGKVDGLYGDDLKMKEMLNRANTKLKGKFVSAMHENGTENKAESRWDVYAQVGEKQKLIFSATVNELTNGKIAALYDQVHDEKFGRKLLATIKSEGSEKATKIFKGAQAVPPAPQMPQLDLGGAPGADPMSGAVSSNVDAGGTGDPKKNLSGLLDQAEATLLDIREGVNALTGESGNELQEMQSMAPPAEATAMAEMLDMQRKLVRGIKVAMIQTGRGLKKNIDELKLAKELYAESKLTKEQKEYLFSLSKSAMSTTNKLLSEAKDHMKSFIMLSEGTKMLKRKASQYSRLQKSAQNFDAATYDPFSPEAQFGTSSKPSGAGYADKSKPTPMAPPAKKPGAPKGLPKVNDKSTFDEMYRARGMGRADLDTTLQNVTGNPGAYSATPKATKAPGQTIQIDDPGNYVAPQDQTAYRMPGPTYPKAKDVHTDTHDYTNDPATFDQDDPDGKWKAGDQLAMNADDIEYDEEDENDACKINDKGEMTADTPEELGKAMKSMKSASETFDLSTKEGRAAKRLKLAEKGTEWSDWLLKSNPKGVTPEMDRKPGGDLAKIEVPSEVHTEMLKMVDLHKTTPPKVKKQAEDIQRAVKEGKIAASDVEELISHGVDADAIKYWKQYYGQAKDGGSEFASEMVKEYDKTKKADEQEASQVKFARAYEMAHEMALRGQIENTPAQLRLQASNIIKWNDEAFNSMQNVIARTPVKNAAMHPPVGHGETESVLGISSFASLAEGAAPVTLVNKYEQAMSSRQSRR